jgi:hypothetical protein
MSTARFITDRGHVMDRHFTFMSGKRRHFHQCSDQAQ